jgi:hypothetical protein
MRWTLDRSPSLVERSLRTEPCRHQRCPRKGRQLARSKVERLVSLMERIVLLARAPPSMRRRPRRRRRSRVRRRRPRYATGHCQTCSPAEAATVVLATARTDRPMVNRAESIRRWQSRSQRNWRPAAGQHQFIAAECPVPLHGSLPQSPLLADTRVSQSGAVRNLVCLRGISIARQTRPAPREDGNHDTPATDLGRASESAAVG